MLSLWYYILGTFLSIITVAGNGFVIYLIVTRPRLHNPTNWVIVSLAIADLLIGSGCILIWYLSEKFSIPHRLHFALPSFLFAASASNLCLLTLDRYIFITKPLRYVTLMTTKRTALLIFTAWMASFLPHFTFFLINDILASAKLHDAERNFMIFDFAVFEVLPIVLLSFAVGRIFYIARQSSRRLALQVVQLRFNQRVGENRGVSAQNQRNSSMKIIGVAVTVFIICYLNDVCYTVLYQLRDGENSKSVYRYVLNLLYIANSALNPVSYALFKRDIKKTLKSIFHCNGGTPFQGIKLSPHTAVSN